MTDQQRHIAVWNECLRIVEQIIEPQPFKTWFTPVRPVSLVESTLTVEVPSDFFREYLESAYLDVIKMTMKRVIGADARLIYSVRTVSKQPLMNLPASKAHIPNPSHNEGMRKTSDAANNSGISFLSPINTTLLSTFVLSIAFWTSLM